MTFSSKPLAFIVCLLLSASSSSGYTRQDTLRGSNGRGRDWWDVLKYDLRVIVDGERNIVTGTSTISFRLTGRPRDSMQIDLQNGLVIKNAKLGGSQLSYNSEGDVYWIHTPEWLFNPEERDKTQHLTIIFVGVPASAINPPWDGGFIWTKDSSGNVWNAVACQGLGASGWWPCKDYQGDEPDSGMTIRIAGTDLSKTIIAVTNGRQYSINDTITIKDPVTGQLVQRTNSSTEGIVHNPINTYNATFYIGNYAHWHDTLHGEKGVLDLDFYPLKYNLAKARTHWAVTKKTLRCYEYWLGPYPFYEDGYKLVEAPYLGMEHQSAIAYGNGYRNGYNGRGLHKDRSGTGVGFSFDFIIAHESGHEWFGNSITARDIADNWLHEGFTTYAECLFVESIKGKDSAFAYTMGEWKNIRNDRPVIGDYGVHDEGSSDKYDKGSAVVHMIRMMINDDSLFRQLLRGLNRDYYHKIVTSSQVEEYISRFVGFELKPFFDVYLRSTKKPVLEWYIANEELRCRWQNAGPDFFAPCLFSMGHRMQYINVPPAQAKFPIKGLSRADIRIIAAGWYDIVEQRF